MKNETNLIQTQIDRILDCFEQELKDGKSPSIDEYCSKSPASIPQCVVLELIGLEIYYLGNDQTQTIDAERYKRFGEDAFEHAVRLLSRNEDGARQRDLEETKSLSYVDTGKQSASALERIVNQLSNTLEESSDLQRFQQAWQSDNRPDLASFLHDCAGAPNREQVIALLATDLQFRFRAGDAPSADDYARYGSEMAGIAQCLILQCNASLGIDSSDQYSSTLVKNGVENRFQKVAEHKRGGLGSVSIAVDTELNRKVALKEILPNYAEDQDKIRRFAIEAEITGQLEHPGIVPIYGFGKGINGSPYYAMRFLHGESLDQLIDQHHKSNATQSDTSKNLEFRQLLNRFVEICQTIHYAHEQGIVHRDLKPQNIMTGEFGETLVVDWGLAKKVQSRNGRQGDIETSELVDSPRDITNTMEGDILGSALYMPPEQASGKLDEIGAVSDIYSLGAILFTILTGKHPVSGNSLDEVLERVRSGDLPIASTRPTSVPKPLWAVCRKAMSLDASKRYQTSSQLGNEIEKYLADESVDARSESFFEKFARFVRKNRSAVAAALLGLLATVIVLTVYSYKQNALRRSETMARESADRNYTFAKKTIDGYVDSIKESNLLRKKGNEELIEDLLVDAKEFYAQLLNIDIPNRATMLDVADAHVRLGTINSMVGKLDSAEQAFLSCVEFVENQTMWSVEAESALILAKCKNELGTLHHYRAPEKAANYYQQSVHILESLRTEDKTDDVLDILATSHSNLGSLLRGDPLEAMKQLHKSIQLRESIDPNAVPINARKLAEVLINLGNVQSLVDTDDAQSTYKHALKIFRELENASELDIVGQQSKATCLLNLGRLEFFDGEYERGISNTTATVELLSKAVATNPYDQPLRFTYASAINNLASFQTNVGKFSEAKDNLDLAVNEFENLLETDPNNGQYNNELAGALGNFKDVYPKDHQKIFGYLKAALIHNEKAIAVLPNDPRVRECYRNNLYQMAISCNELQRYQDAVAASKELMVYSKDPDELYNAGWYTAMAIIFMEKDESLSEQSRQELREQYATQAVQAIEAAIENGFSDFGYLKSDQGLDHLRKRNDFKKLLSD